MLRYMLYGRETKKYYCLVRFVAEEAIASVTKVLETQRCKQNITFNISPAQWRFKLLVPIRSSSVKQRKTYGGIRFFMNVFGLCLPHVAFDCAHYLIILC